VVTSPEVAPLGDQGEPARVLENADSGRGPRPLEAVVSLGHAFALETGDQDREEHPTETTQRIDLLHPPDHQCRG